MFRNELRIRKLAYFDDWVKFLAYQREISGPFAVIKKDLLEDYT